MAQAMNVDFYDDNKDRIFWSATLNGVSVEVTASYSQNGVHRVMTVLDGVLMGENEGAFGPLWKRAEMDAEVRDNLSVLVKQADPVASGLCDEEEAAERPDLVAECARRAALASRALVAWV